MADYIKWFDELSKKDIGVAGGKGANLGEMYQAGFPIPPGFVVTGDAYWDFLLETGLKQKITKLLNDLNVDDNKSLQSVAKKTQELIKNAEMPRDIKKRIKEAYDDMKLGNYTTEVNTATTEIIKSGRDNTRTAIRSSATAEDLPSVDKDSHVLVKVDDKPVYDTIENIYEDYYLNKGKSIEVAAMEDNEVVWRKIDDLYAHPASGEELYKIITETGREVVVSNTHSLIVLDKSELKPRTCFVNDLDEEEFVPVTKNIPLINNMKSELNVLDYVKGDDVIVEEGEVYIKNKSTNWRIQNPLKKTISVDDEFAYFLGLYCAEGSTYEDNCVIVTNSDEEVMNKVIKFMKRLGLYSGQKLNKHSLRVYCKPLVRLLHELTGKPLSMKGKGKSCSIKRVPNFIFACNKSLISSFLKGCFDGDGCVEKASVTYSSSSEKLTGGILKLLEMLKFEFYIRRRKGKYFEIKIPYSQASKFKELIGFNHEERSKRLKEIIKDYEEKSVHPSFKNSFQVPPGLTERIKRDFDTNLPKEDVKVAFCPECGEEVEKTSYYNDKLRFYCRDCSRTFYKDDVECGEVAKYVNYDERGRFTENSTPWNKGLISGRVSKKEFTNYLQSIGLSEYGELFDKSVLWDKVKRVEEVDYTGNVYDFTVPGVQNFAAGMGGVITHNSASFAGQQESYLNVQGGDDVVKYVQYCWASLFTARAIYYREKNDFPHMKVKIAVIVQKMVNSEVSGVGFSVHPSTGAENEVLIEAGYGLGEAIVKGEVNPDLYIVNKNDLSIKSKDVKKQPRKLIRKRSGESKWVDVPKDMQESQVLYDSNVKKLAKIIKNIEAHYEKPQDVEWAMEGGKLYIVQSRPVTALNKLKTDTVSEEVKSESEAILHGLGASPGVAVGKVVKVKDASELSNVHEGDIMVTKMTDPNMVPAMKRAEGIITDEGGLTCHASIVSRELGIPCIVGTEKATKVLENSDKVTLDATNGVVYKGKSEEVLESAELEEAGTGEEKTGGVPRRGYGKVVTGTEIHVNLSSPEIVDKIKGRGFDGVGLLRAEFIAAGLNQHPSALIKQGKGAEFVDKFAKSIANVCREVQPKPVTYRSLDFKTNEYRNLKGGEEFEPEERNPMIGWRGASRYISPEYEKTFRLELKALKKVRDTYGLTNVELMIPFVRNEWELRKIFNIIGEEGLMNIGMKIGIMVEVPSTVILIDKFCEMGIDFISIGTNDLTQLVLGVDRDSAKLGDWFDERNEAVLRCLERTIRIAKEAGVTTSICGQAPSVYPEITRFLVKQGIDKISVNPDVIEQTRELVAQIEHKLLVENIIKKPEEDETIL